MAAKTLAVERKVAQVDIALQLAFRKSAQTEIDAKFLEITSLQNRSSLYSDEFTRLMAAQVKLTEEVIPLQSQYAIGHTVPEDFELVVEECDRLTNRAKCVRQCEDFSSILSTPAYSAFFAERDKSKIYARSEQSRISVLLVWPLKQRKYVKKDQTQLCKRCDKGHFSKSREKMCAIVAGERVVAIETKLKDPKNCMKK